MGNSLAPPPKGHLAGGVFMKLSFVEAEGFRGFREKVRIDFATGFTVLTGRSGVGKSTP
jgi:putative ribosome biogenesis GTPase RsgA